MKTKQSWIKDVEDLLQQSVVEDAFAQTQERWDEAVASLDAESQDLIARYFDGATVEQLSEERSLTAEQVTLWIARLKRELTQKLRERFQVRQ